MTFQKQSIPQPNVERWVDEDEPSVVAYTQTGTLGTTVIVEYGMTQRGFAQVPVEYARAVIAALTAVTDTLVEEGA